MKFRDFFNLRQILFSLFIIALVLIAAFFAADKVVQVEFQKTQLMVWSDEYTLKIPYDEILSAQLADTPQDDEPIDGVENIITHYSTWKNEQWGEYTACLDMNSPKCIVLKLTDGQIYVFSRKSETVTTEIYETLLTHIG